MLLLHESFIWIVCLKIWTSCKWTLEVLASLLKKFDLQNLPAPFIRYHEWLRILVSGCTWGTSSFRHLEIASFSCSLSFGNFYFCCCCLHFHWVPENGGTVANSPVMNIPNCFLWILISLTFGKVVNLKPYEDLPLGWL